MVDPTTENVIPAQLTMDKLDKALFQTGDKFNNTVNQVHITFLGDIGKDVTTLYSKQELTASVIQSNLKALNTSSDRYVH